MTTIPPKAEHKEKQGSILCEALRKKEKITAKDAKNALAYQAEFGGNIVAILIRLGAISEENILDFLEGFWNIKRIAAGDLPQSAKNFIEVVKASKIELDWWLDQEILAWFGTDRRLLYIAKDVTSPFLSEILERTFPEHILEPRLARSYDLAKALEMVNASVKKSSENIDIQHLKELAEEAPVIEFVANLLSQALDQGASDIHIEPGKEQMEVRFRIDGILYSRFTLPKERYAAISSRIKLVSGIDISERRLPQDGRVSMRISGSEVDLRVSSVPGVYGESIVLRLLPKNQHIYQIDELGMLPDHQQMLSTWAQSTNGIILVTGPTGSGKSTTLYAALNLINDGQKKIITVEDPVEYYLEGTSQIQTHTEIGYSFSRALRSIMRQDPDVIMIGEIRDRETAEIAVQASLTGHLVFSTLHTNSSLGAFIRLIDMGIDPFLVATPIRAVMAQRLVRRLCQNCAVTAQIPQEIEKEIEPWFPHDKAPQWKQPVGCEECQHTGYHGRIGIHEFVPVSPAIQELILKKANEMEMWELIKKQKIRNIRQDGLLKARMGLTSVEEVFLHAEGQHS